MRFSSYWSGLGENQWSQGKSTSYYIYVFLLLWKIVLRHGTFWKLCICLSVQLMWKIMVLGISQLTVTSLSAEETKTYD